LERWRDRSVENFNIVREHFDFAGLQVSIASTFWTRTHQTSDTQAEFITDGLSSSKHVCTIRVTNNLYQTFTITQINKNHTAVVTTAMHPAAQADGLAE